MTSKNVLLVNGISSGATGILLIAFADFFARLFQLTDTMIFTGVGIFLVAFATFVIGVALNGKAERSKIRLIITLDVIWTVSSFILVMLFHEEVSFMGNALIIAVALWVTAMIFLQTKSLKQITL